MTDWPQPQTPADGLSPAPKGHGAKSAAVRQRAIVALLSEPSLGLAAKRCGVGERTLRRWMANDEAFQAELANARRATFEAGLVRVQALAELAVQTLEELLGAKKHPAVRLGAARTVLEMATASHDAEVLLNRVNDLLARVRAMEQADGWRRRA